MVGDMFNYSLKSKVDGLCSELSQLLAQQPFVPVTFRRTGYQGRSTWLVRMLRSASSSWR